MKRKVIFDSNILVSLSKGEIDPVRFADAFCKNKWLVSIITKIEVLSKPLLTAEDERFLLKFLTECKTINLSRSIVSETIRFRQTNRRKLPDSIIAATAVTLGAALISNDSHLLQVQYPALAVEPFELLSVSS